MMTIFVSMYQRVRAKLKKMALILKPKIADGSLECAEVFKPQACGALAADIGPLLID